jgi:hypothetical protein
VVPIALVGLGLLIGALLPATRRVFLDRRVRHASVGAAAYQVLLRIPVGTVLLEEIAFRGVLYVLVREMYGTAWATALRGCLGRPVTVVPSATNWLSARGPRLVPAPSAGRVSPRPTRVRPVVADDGPRGGGGRRFLVRRGSLAC